MRTASRNAQVTRSIGFSSSPTAELPPAIQLPPMPGEKCPSRQTKANRVPHDVSCSFGARRREDKRRGSTRSVANWSMQMFSLGAWLRISALATWAHMDANPRSRVNRLSGADHRCRAAAAARRQNPARALEQPFLPAERPSVSGTEPSGDLPLPRLPGRCASRRPRPHGADDRDPGKGQSGCRDGRPRSPEWRSGSSCRVARLQTGHSEGRLEHHPLHRCDIVGTGKPCRADLSGDGVMVERNGFDRMPLDRVRRADSVIEAGDQHPVVRPLALSERSAEQHGGIGGEVAPMARMQVPLHAAYREP